MNTLRRILSIALLGIAAQPALHAQDGAIGSEHRYQFTFVQDLGSYQEKLMLESISSLDPGMRVAISRPERLMKVLAYRPLDPQEIMNMAALHGVSIQHRREGVEVSPATISNQ